MDEENVFPVPNLKHQQHLFVLMNSSSNASADKQKARQTAGTELLKGIEADGTYERTSSSSVLKKDC